MNVVIVEDEAMAVERLEHALSLCAPGAVVKARLTGVQETVAWLDRNEAPDLLFLDIMLSDGLAWDIFSAREVTCPVIFTTAYDNYLMRAFTQNGIEYLLKPIDQARLGAAIAKYRSLEIHFNRENFDSFNAIAAPSNPLNMMRRRFVVRKGAGFLSVPVESVAFFFCDEKLTFLVDLVGECFRMDDSLTIVETQVDPDLFFRANRQYLVSVASIIGFRTNDKSGIDLEIRHLGKRSVTVSRGRARDFRLWIDS